MGSDLWVLPIDISSFKRHKHGQKYNEALFTKLLILKLKNI